MVSTFLPQFAQQEFKPKIITHQEEMESKKEPKKLYGRGNLHGGEIKG
jgi:hypothetical protein